MFVSICPVLSPTPMPAADQGISHLIPSTVHRSHGAHSLLYCFPDLPHIVLSSPFTDLHFFPFIAFRPTQVAAAAAQWTSLSHLVPTLGFCCEEVQALATTMQYNTIQYNTIHQNTIQYNTQWNGSNGTSPTLIRCFQIHMFSRPGEAALQTPA